MNTLIEPNPRWERELLAAMFAGDSTADSILARIDVDGFSNSGCRKIAKFIAQTRKGGHSIGGSTLLDRCDSLELKTLIWNLSIEEFEVDLPLDDYIYRFADRHLGAQVESLCDAIRLALPGADMKGLLERHRDLTAQRKKLSEGRGNS